MMADLRGASVAQARRALAADLRRAGIESPELDARVLLGCALGLDHTGLVKAAAQQLSDLSACAAERLIERRIAGEPVARIVGQKEFWGLPFVVTPAVLVPRPETETVVELALALIDQDGPRTRALDILDLATGSGAILLALLSELPESRGLGTDIDPDALAVAKLNANRLTLAHRARFAGGDFGAALDGAFDLVVSNPPYIAAAGIAALAREVREHDPRRALDGGADGLDAYRAIAGDAGRLLRPTGHLVVEIGAGQRFQVARIFETAGLATVTVRSDLSGIERAVAFRPG